MILKAKNKLSEWNIKTFNIDEVYWQMDEAALQDFRFRNAINKSLNERGMLWPPIVWLQETFMIYAQEQSHRIDPTKATEQDLKYRCAIGNNRFNYAKQNGYEKIECVYAPTWQDKDTILKSTYMEYCVDF
jgi:hypothetical protein